MAAAGVAELLRSLIDQAGASLNSLSVRDDTKYSLCVGALLGLASLVLLLRYPGEPIDYGTMADGSQLPEQLRYDRPAEEKQQQQQRSDEGGASVYPQERAGERELRRRRGGERAPASAAGAAAGAEEIDEDAAVSKLHGSKLSKVLGLSEEQVRDAVREAKREAREGASYVPPPSQRQNLSVGLDVVVLVFLVGALLYYMYQEKNSGLVRFLLSMFPKEMETLGFGSTDRSPQQTG